MNSHLLLILVFRVIGSSCPIVFQAPFPWRFDPRTREHFPFVQGVKRGFSADRNLVGEDDLDSDEMVELSPKTGQERGIFNHL